MAAKLTDLFSRFEESVNVVGALATSDTEGNVNCAVFRLPQLIDDKTVVIVMSECRTFKNLQGNPRAAFLLAEPSDDPWVWKGVRIYLKVRSIETSGEMLERSKAHIAEKAGKKAAEMMHAAVTFDISGIRPLIDVGQNWEEAI